MKRLLEKHPDGTEVWFETYDEDKFRIYTITNVDPVLEQNKRLQNDPEYSRRGIKNGWWHYASIPCDVLAHWHHQGIINLNYPLSPVRTDGKLHRMRRRFLEATRQYEALREMDRREEWAQRNKEAITRMLNDPDYRYLKTVSGRV